jgi:predicted nucleic acid-binding protein
MVALQIRDVPDEVRDVLAERARARGQSLQAFLLSVLREEARRSRNLALLERFADRSDGSRHQVTDARARDAVAALDEAAIELVPSVPLLSRMWQLRHSVSGYDAAYVAAAEAHRCALLTADARLGRAHGVTCEIRLCLPP